IRSGVALLSGLIFCGRCGLRIASVYNSSGSRLRYAYNQMAINYGEALCQLLAGQLVDDWVSTQVLRVLEPATLEISLRSRLIWRANDNTCTSIGGNGWNGRNTRSNGRLVNTRRSSPSTLERQWEEALTAEAALQADYARFQAEQPPGPDR
ncbi:MAG TPA: zinc ribbon domain-containing protein, partial [Candidatus Competibacteraceae bacterium]|nr:zinc ribbon domain-containing protein [Candidatus Competibacteraceae bacterium]